MEKFIKDVAKGHVQIMSEERPLPEKMLVHTIMTTLHGLNTVLWYRMSKNMLTGAKELMADATLGGKVFWGVGGLAATGAAACGSIVAALYTIYGLTYLAKDTKEIEEALISEDEQEKPKTLRK